MDQEQHAEGMESGIDPDQLSKLVKQQAEGQKIVVELTEEQARAILAQWDERDPRAPAQVTFVVESREVAELAVAGYRYRGDTCCV